MNKDEFVKLLEKTRIPGECSDWTPYMQPIEDALLEILPQQLYRFRSINEYSLSAFDKDLIFFSRAKDFNDPYDTLISSNSFETIRQLPPEILSIFMNYVGEQLAKGVEIPNNIQNMFPKSSLNQMLDYVKIHVNEAKCGKCKAPDWQEIFVNLNTVVTDCERDLRNSDSYACFSESIDSMTMWVHYADYHKGFALSYDMRRLVQTKPNGLRIFPVIYSAVRYESTSLLGWSTAQKIGIPMVHIDQLDKVKSALYKSLDWEYEREWRLINSIDCDSPHPSIEYPPTGIYYGSRISEINKKILHNIAVEKGLKEYEMYIDRSSSDYHMRIRPLSFEG